MTYKALLLEIEGPIATITLNRPEHLNALNMDLSKELLEAVLNCSEDKNIRVVVITGAGNAFSAGGDVKAF
ncbi:MAG TPA: enoyl-CoA hydratase/isomerase family protein, partial [candidate division Zixibacteria bacterium]|nr:enoyl-CoA hydratase/isomerase family protein [candidate division Zixibacteria bacterium]